MSTISFGNREICYFFDFWPSLGATWLAFGGSAPVKNLGKIPLDFEA